MGNPLVEKLSTELLRYQNRGFLEAVMAVCTLTACADDEVGAIERYRINQAIAREPSLQVFESDTCADMLEQYIDDVHRDEAKAKTKLYKKIRKMSGHHKRSRTLMRLAYLIIVADREIYPNELHEFERICVLLALEPDNVWNQLTKSE